MICIGCGCDESHACTLPGGAACAWIHAGPRQLAGICTACVELYPPSTVEEELRIAEIAIAAAIDDGIEEERIGGLVRAGVPVGISDHLDRQNPARILEDITGLDFGREAAYLDELVDPAGEPQSLSFLEPDRRLILPGDKDFHL